AALPIDPRATTAPRSRAAARCTSTASSSCASATPSPAAPPAPRAAPTYSPEADMAEMDRHTGDLIDDELAAIEQSVTDILTTLVGTRIERRDYGSVLPLLIDQPLTEATLLRVYSAAIIAI